MQQIPEKTVARLSLYRRLLTKMLPDSDFVRSQEIANLARGTPAQVRRDIMSLGCHGTRNKGYRIKDLLDSIGQLLDSPELQEAAIVGVGNLGHALLAYLVGRRPNLNIRAAFDRDPEKNGLVINGCPCFDMESMPNVMEAFRIRIAILAVPAGAAQSVAEQLIACGIDGILNFAPVRLHVPESVYVEDMDISASLERVAFFSRIRTQKTRPIQPEKSKIADVPPLT